MSSNQTGFFVSASSSLTSEHRYPNGASCVFVNSVDAAYVRYDIEFDLESTFDALEAHGANGMWASLTGEGRQLLTLPVDPGTQTTRLHLVTDRTGRRSGFRAHFEASPTVCETAAHCSHHGSCVEGTCVCHEGWHGLACGSPVCLTVERLQRGVRGDIRPGVRIPALADCSWHMSAEENNHGSATLGVRLAFAGISMLEPAKGSRDAGDELSISKHLNPAAPVLQRIAQRRCASGRDCDQNFQTGVCFQGVCAARAYIDILETNLTLKLSTDRNDGEWVANRTGDGALQLTEWYTLGHCPENDVRRIRPDPIPSHPLPSPPIPSHPHLMIP